MGGPKSDEATVQARRFRLNELLLAGKTVAQAGEVLRAEGFPASHDTVEKDEKTLALVWRRDNAAGYELVLSNQFLWLQELKRDLKSPSIKDGDKISLALSILDREMRLVGTEAPSRSISQHISSQLDPLYLDIRSLLQDLEESVQQEGLEVLRAWAATKAPTTIEATRTLEDHAATSTDIS
jgi:hypothetical protein